MEKIKNIPLVLLCLFGAKALILHPNLSEVGIFALLCSITAFLEYKGLDAYKKEINEKLIKQEQRLTDLEKRSDSLTSNISSLKIANGFRGVKTPNG